MILLAQCDRCGRVIYLPDETVIELEDESVCTHCYNDEPKEQKPDEAANNAAKALITIALKQRELQREAIT